MDRGSRETFLLAIKAKLAQNVGEEVTTPLVGSARPLVSADPPKEALL